MFIDSNKTNVFFTSDTHFGHKNIIKYCNRPHFDIKDMNQSLVQRWNHVVKPNDVVFHIGDVCFLKEQKDINDLIHSLNGTIHLIPGNHDVVQNFKHPALKDKIHVQDKLMELDIQVEDEKLHFVLCHYAMRVWNKSHYGSIHLFGHSHGTLPDDPNSRSMDVGVDSNDFVPLSVDEVLLKMYRKVFKPVDHHSGERK